MWIKLNCIACKILSLAIVLLSLAYPFIAFIYQGVEVNTLNIIIMLFIAGTFAMIGFCGVLKTNHPLHRYNIFTIDPNFKGSGKSLDEDPGQLFEFNKPTKEQIRDEKINDLIK